MTRAHVLLAKSIFHRIAARRMSLRTEACRRHAQMKVALISHARARHIDINSRAPEGVRVALHCSSSSGVNIGRHDDGHSFRKKRGCAACVNATPCAICLPSPPGIRFFTARRYIRRRFDCRHSLSAIYEARYRCRTSVEI